MRENSNNPIEKSLKSISMDTFFPGHSTKEILESLKTAFKDEKKYWKVQEDQQFENAFFLEMFPDYSKKRVLINIAIKNEKLKIWVSVSDKILRNECFELQERSIKDLFKNVSKFDTDFKKNFDSAVLYAFSTKEEEEAQHNAAMNKYARG